MVPFYDKIFIEKNVFMLKKTATIYCQCKYGTIFVSNVPFVFLKVCGLKTDHMMLDFL